jgi:hypothetical protein
MSIPPNPYAPPQAPLSSGSGGRVWREGAILVLEPGAELPPRCVKCDEPAELPLKPRTLYWHHPALYILALVALLLYAIVALIVRKQATVAPGLCLAHRKRRTLWITVGILGPLLGFPIMTLSQGECGPIFLGALLFLGGLIGGLMGARIVYPERIDPQEVRLKGCGEAFLASLSSYPG